LHAKLGVSTTGLDWWEKGTTTMAGVLHTNYGRMKREMIHDYHPEHLLINSFEYWLVIHLQSSLATTTMLLLQASMFCDSFTASGAEPPPRDPVDTEFGG
jgi:hypothetical protein